MRLHYIGRGSNGAVFRTPGGLDAAPRIVKWTTDPQEVAAWLAVRALTARGHPPAGFPVTHSLHLGHRVAVLVREDVAPLTEPGAARALPLGVLEGLHRGSLLLAAGRLDGQPAVARRGARTLRIALGNALLHPVARGLYALAPFGVAPSDLRPSNLGTVRQSTVLHDPGRTPIEAAVGGSEAASRCPNVEALTRDVAATLNRGVDYTACRVVNRTQLAYVMRSHGWSASEIDGTAGFRSRDGALYLREGEEWALLHELVHAAGINADSLATWWIEGLTEAVAQDVARAAGRQHTAVYGREVAAVRALAQRLGTTVVALGRQVASSPERATRDVAVRLAGLTGTDASAWAHALRAGSPLQAARGLLGGGRGTPGVGRGAHWARLQAAARRRHG